MTIFSSWRASIVGFLGSLVWCAYLLLLVAASFINELYSSQAWLLMTSAVYSVIGLHILCIINGGESNWSGLARAKYAIAVLGLMLGLLVAQITVPLSLYTNTLLLEGGAAPSWFEPSLSLSIVPIKTRFLLNSELLFFSMFVLTVALIGNRNRLKQLLITIMIVGLAHSCIGVVAKVNSLLLVDAQRVDGHFDVARGLFINRNHFAAFVSLLMIGPLALQLKFMMSRKGAAIGLTLLEQFTSFRVVFLLSLSVGLIAIVLSQSRAGTLAIVTSMLAVFAYFSRSSRTTDSIVSLQWLILPMVLVIAIISYFGADLLQRFSTGDFLGERLSQWSVTWSAIENAWLFGYGGNSYTDVFQIMRGYQDFRQVLFDQSHNDYLHILLEQGLVGLILWLSLIVLALSAAFTGVSDTSSSLIKATLISVGIVLLAALAQSFVDFNLQILNIRFYFFVIMSLCFAVPSIGRRRRRSDHSIFQ